MRSGDELVERSRTAGALAFEVGDRVLVHVVGDALVPAGHQPPDHVGAHPSEADHAELHRARLPRRRLPSGVMRCRLLATSRRDGRPASSISGIAGAAGAHQRLLARLDARTDFDPRQPSLLPDWTVGHVLTHIARNADSMIRMLDGLDQYEGGIEGRRADIEAGAGRPPDELIADVRAFDLAVGAAVGAGAGMGRSAGEGDVSARCRAYVLPSQTVARDRGASRRPRLRLHVRRHAGTTSCAPSCDGWRCSGQARQPMGLTTLPEAVLQRPPPERLAWLMGRIEIDGVAPAGVF